MVLQRIWRDIQEEFVAHFGFSDSHVEYMRKQRELADLLDQRIMTGDRTLNAFIKVCMLELAEMDNDMQEASGRTDFWYLKGLLDKAGFKIMPMRTSVKEFYTHLRTLSKESKSKQSDKNIQENG